VPVVVAENDGEGSFWRKHAHQRYCLNIAKMYSVRRVIPLLQEIGVSEANVDVRFFTGSFYIAVYAHAQ